MAEQILPHNLAGPAGGRGGDGGGAADLRQGWLDRRTSNLLLAAAAGLLHPARHHHRLLLGLAEDGEDDAVNDDTA